MNVCNLFSSPLSSIYGSPPPSPKGLPRAEMMVPRHTLERGEPSRMPNEDTSSEEGEAPNMEVAHRGLMVEVEDLFRYRHFRDKQIIEWSYIEAPVLAVLGIQGEFERMTSQPFWRHICSWRDATYVPIVREFISTLEVNEGVHNRRQPSIKFNLFHRQYNISSDELGNLLGFYTLHDQDQGWYANLVDDFPNEHQPELFWWGIARQRVAWRPSYTSAKYIKVPELKIMWHIIARSWLCEALGFEVALAYEAVATTMTPLDIGDFLQFGIAPEEPSEDEARGERRDLWGIIERLENRVNTLKQEVRRLTLERFGQESDGSGI
nr:probable RNA-dependent RNA polymerase 1 [Ipomoea batatas]